MVEYLEYQLKNVTRNIERLENEIEKDMCNIKNMQPIFIKQIGEKIFELAELKNKKIDLLDNLEYARRIILEK